MLEIFFDANFSCTSPPHAKPVDALACALHTEAIRVFQGDFAQRLSIKNDTFM